MTVVPTSWFDAALMAVIAVCLVVAVVGLNWDKLRPKPKPRVDYTLLARLEHDEMPQEKWTPEAHLAQHCYRCLPQLNVPVMRPMAAGTWRRPTVLVEHDEYEVVDEMRGVVRVPHYGPTPPDGARHGTVWVETTPEPDERGPE